MENKKYYKSLDIIRVISVIAVFLYHLNILKGGFLAVCVFFVLTGYLSFTSSFNKEKFSIKDYYISRFKKIYLPFLMVVFISIFVISLYPSINWLNLKPETTSAIFGYNNFWQLNASLDYFARHVDSPFMHFWYIAILLQFELVFPLIFVGIKKFNEKFNKNIILVILIVLSLLGTSYFVYSSYYNNIMYTYYSTYTRLFSILYGVTLGYVNSYYKNLIPSKLNNSKYSKIVFYLYLIILIVLFFIADSSSEFFYICMIISSLIACRLIEYSVTNNDNNLNFINKVNKFLSSISYEIYLVQYPVIFLFQELGINFTCSVLLIICITVLISYIIHFSLNYKDEESKIALLKIGLTTMFFTLYILGFSKYLVAEDHTEELKELENQLAKNQEIMEQRQQEYALRLKEEENKLHDELENLDQQEANLKEIITNLSVIGIGDSVMLGAIKSLYSVFPNGYFDAKTSRTDYVANGILLDLSRRGILGDPIIFGLGTNGQCGSRCRVNIKNTCGNRKMFWITTTNKKTAYINSQLKEEAKNDKNMYIIDWEAESANHSEYFVSDKIHLTSAGRVAYSNFIYNEVYKVYLEEIQNKKETMIREKEDKEKAKLYFYGNDILLNSFEGIKEEFENSTFDINNFSYDTLYNELENETKNELSNNFVLMFDSSFKINESEYKKLIDLLENKNIYVLFINSKYNLNYKDVKVINIDLTDYLSIDRIHLTNEGNELLTMKLKEYFEF